VHDVDREESGRAAREERALVESGPKRAYLLGARLGVLLEYRLDGEGFDRRPRRSPR
jgi:hypothetical protein